MPRLCPSHDSTGAIPTVLAMPAPAGPLWPPGDHKARKSEDSEQPSGEANSPGAWFQRKRRSQPLALPHSRGCSRLSLTTNPPTITPSHGKIYPHRRKGPFIIPLHWLLGNLRCAALALLVGFSWCVCVCACVCVRVPPGLFFFQELLGNLSKLHKGFVHFCLETMPICGTFRVKMRPRSVRADY